MVIPTFSGNIYDINVAFDFFGNILEHISTSSNPKTSNLEIQ